jgi:hypothetical protein
VLAALSQVYLLAKTPLVAGDGERVAAGVAEHVGMDLESEASARADALDEPGYRVEIVKLTVPQEQQPITSRGPLLAAGPAAVTNTLI